MATHARLGVVAVGVFALSSALAGCIHYVPGSLAERRRPLAAVRTVGCVDVAVEILEHPEIDLGSPVVDVNFGNVCHEGVMLDLSKLQVTASYQGAAMMRRLRAYDPRHEIEGKMLLPVWSGHEALEFDPETKIGERPTRVCVDVSGIVPALGPTPPMCFHWDAVAAALVPEGVGS